jgi:hypothetical protein
MEMDDDDLVGQIEFDLTAEQRKVVSRAIDLASASRDDEFRHINPLIAIMQWWDEHVPQSQKLKGSPEATLAEACRLFVLAHEARA